MTSLLRHAICCSVKNCDEKSCDVERVQSFASFCVSVLVDHTSLVHCSHPVIHGVPSACDKRDNVRGESVHGHEHELEHGDKKDEFHQIMCSAIREVASAYINGEPLDHHIEILFRELTRGRGRGRDLSVESNPTGVPNSPTSFQRRDLQIFQKNLVGCLENTLLHEYLSTDWNRIEDFIWVNKKQRHFIGKNDISNKDCILNIKYSRDDSGNCKNVTCFSWSRCNWETTRKAYFQKAMQRDLSFVRISSTIASLERQGNGFNIGSNGSSMKDPSKFSHWRCPTVYFLGGGMGAGKSSVISYLKATDDEMFQNNPVVVEADAFKHSDPIFHALNALFEKKGAATRVNGGSNNCSCNGKDDRVSQLVHDHSTKAANQQLVVALANQRDVVVDGTMTWMPYVRQTIAMVRDVHKHRYLLGPGYSKDNEQYWERAEPMDEDLLLLPYRVEMVGVTVDAEHAVSRGIRRAIITGRAVPVRGQLRSHRLYSEHFPTYAAGKDIDKNGNQNMSLRGRRRVLFDRIRLFDTTNRLEEAHNDTTHASPAKSNPLCRPPPRCIAWRDSPDQPLSFIPDAYEEFLNKKYINDVATGVADLYKENGKSNVHMDNATIHQKVLMGWIGHRDS